MIARGGFAAVYRGWQPACNRWVAVKFLAGHHGGSSVYRFDHEVRAVGSLSEHPHVVPVYEANEIDGLPFLVMPYLTGGSLQQRMQAGPVDTRQAVATAQAVADALAEAHRLGILHRDIKPANILFTAYGVPQLADFGLARFSDSTLTGGLLAVTVSYAAPEVLSGEQATPLSDVYSLGATLYAALRGTPPFSGRDGEPPVAHAMRIVHEQPEPLRSFGVPAAVAGVVERAMAKNPADRYHSAVELRDALGAAADAAAAAAAQAAAEQTAPAAIAPVPPPGPDPYPHPAHAAPPAPVLALAGKHRRLLAAGAAALILAAGGTAIGVSMSGGSHPAAHRTSAPTTKAPAPTSTTPTTAQASGSTSAGDMPPSAGGATSPADIAPATLDGTLRAYYALVDQHRLDQSWQWLSPAFQAQIGQSYYQQFWDSISQVQVVSVDSSGGQAQITLRYSGANGNTSVEGANLGFAIDNGHILIDTDRVTHG